MEPEKRFLTVDEVAGLLGVSRRRVGQMIEGDRARSPEKRRVPSARKATSVEAMELLESKRIKTIPHGGILVVDSADVTVLQQRNRRGGRPRKQVEAVQGKLALHPFDDLVEEARARPEGVQEKSDEEPLQDAGMIRWPNVFNQKKWQPSAPETKHGVLWKGRVSHVADDRWKERLVAPETTVSLGALCQIALEEHLSHLWVLDPVHADVSYLEAALSEWDLLENWTYPANRRLPPHRTNLLATVSGYRRSERGGQRRVSIIFPAHARRHWRWVHRAKTAQEVLLTLLFLERALGVAVTASASTVGMRLLETIQRGYKHPDWLVIPTIDWSTLPFRWKDVAADLIWSRPLSSEDLGKRYLHKIDKNGAYLRACVAEKFGVGTPVHVNGEKGEAQRFPGVWRCSFTPVHSPDLPPAWNGGSWITSPLVRLLKQTGHSVQIHEGWMWEESHEVLRRWATTLWEARLSFREEMPEVSVDVRSLVEDACKQVATATIGLTSYSQFEEGTFKYRPDWKMHVIGAVRATMYHNVLKLYQELQVVPVMVYMDALYVFSDEPETEKALASLMQRQASLGGYKVGWKRPLVVTSQVKEVLSATSLSVSQKLEVLNAMVEKEMYGVRR